MHGVGGQKRLNFHALFSTFKMDRIIAEERLYFGKDVEVLLTPEDENPPPSGRAYRSLVWDQFLVCPSFLTNLIASQVGSSLRIVLPERFYLEFAMRLDLLREILNGPLYSVVTFANERFNGKLVEFADSSSTPRGFSPGDVFILVLEGSLELAVIPPGRGDSTQKRVLKTGDVFYLPLQFGHRVNVPPGSTHAIALSIINTASGIMKEFEPQILNVSRASS